MADTVNIVGLTYEDLLAEAETLFGKLLPAYDFSNTNDPMRVIVETYLHALDRSNQLVNMRAREFNILTAVDRYSVRGHLKKYGYELSTAQPATLTLSLTIQSDASPRTISKGDLRVSTKGEGGETIYFENYADITIPALATSSNAVFVEGLRYTEEFVSTGTKDLTYRLLNNPVIIEETLSVSLEVTVDAVVWTKVESLKEVDEYSKSYTVDIDSEGYALVTFGDNINGLIPGSSSAISIVYRKGGGLSGNVAVVGSVNKLSVSPNYITAVSNVTKGAGGSESEDLGEAKRRAIANFRDGGQLNRLGSIVNYVESLSGVDRAGAQLLGETIFVYVVPSSDSLWSEVRDNIKTLVETRVLLGYYIHVTLPEYIEVPVDLSIYLTPWAKQSNVESQVRETINNLLSPDGLDSEGNYINEFGRGILRARIFYEIMRISGVENVVINAPTADLSMEPHQIVTPNHVASTLTLEFVGGAETAYYE